MGTLKVAALVVFGAVAVLGQQSTWLASNDAGDRVLLGIHYKLNNEPETLNVPRLYELDGKHARLLGTGGTAPIRCNRGFGDPSYVPGTNEITYSHVTACTERFDINISIQNNRWIPDGTIAAGLFWSGNGDYALLAGLFGQPYRLVRISDGVTHNIPRGTFVQMFGPSNSGQLIWMDYRTVTRPDRSYRVAQPKLWSKGLLTELPVGDSLFCAVDPQDRYVVCLTLDGRYVAISLPTLDTRVLMHYDLPVRFEQGTTTRVQTNRSGDRLLLWGPDQSIFILSMPDGNGIYHAQLPPRWALQSLSADGRYLFYYLMNFSVHRLDLETSIDEEWLPPQPTP